MLTSLQTWKDLDQQVVATNDEVEQIASSDPACQRLRQSPGGPLVATAIVPALGNEAASIKAVSLSMAGLFGISKRGNRYLRKLFVHGARSVVLIVKRERSPFGPWLDGSNNERR
ncbi:MAG: hypothetical protein ACRYFU_12095 [Janthinobacterium lividum]